MINIKIKEGPPVKQGEPGIPVTERIWLVDGDETHLGARPLEPQEVVSLEDDHANELLEKLPYHLEQTSLPPTRELYIEGDWKSSSRFYATETDNTQEGIAKREAELASTMSNPDYILQLMKDNEALRQENTKTQQKLDQLIAKMETKKK